MFAGEPKRMSRAVPPSSHRHSLCEPRARPSHSRPSPASFPNRFRLPTSPPQKKHKTTTTTNEQTKQQSKQQKGPLFLLFLRLNPRAPTARPEGGSGTRFLSPHPPNGVYYSYREMNFIGNKATITPGNLQYAAAIPTRRVKITRNLLFRE